MTRVRLNKEHRGIISLGRYTKFRLDSGIVGTLMQIQLSSNLMPNTLMVSGIAEPEVSKNQMLTPSQL